jgi:hypothetical protein
VAILISLFPFWKIVPRKIWQPCSKRLLDIWSIGQGCQMVSFQTNTSNVGKFWCALDWKMLIYLMAICNISRTLGIFYDHMVHFFLIWYIFSGFGIVYQEKSGNPAVGLIYGVGVIAVGQIFSSDISALG